MSDRSRRLRRLLKRLAKYAAVTLAVVTGVIAIIVAANYAAFGKRASGERKARMTRSPQWTGDGFENPDPLWNDFSVSGLVYALRSGSDVASPEDPEHEIPVVRGDGSRFATPPPSGLRVTWFGHSSMLIEIDGKRVLTDPIWGPSPSPVTWLGPSRWYAPPIALADLPSVDAVIISHDHYDHLDYATFQTIKDWDTTFYVPLGVGAHLAYWGVPEARIVELDWWERRTIEGLEVVCTPARHASGRGLFDQNATLWAGWALLGPTHRAFFSGDTGLFDGMKRIGAELGPFDLTMIEVGAYHRNWPDWHIGPEQAVLAHQWLRGEVFMPVHWGLFNLAFHAWTEPAERVMTASAKAGVTTFIPKPGQSVEPAAPPPLERWWPQVPYDTAEDHPIVSNRANGHPAHAD